MPRRPIRDCDTPGTILGETLPGSRYRVAAPGRSIRTRRALNSLGMRWISSITTRPLNGAMASSGSRSRTRSASRSKSKKTASGSAAATCSASVVFPHPRGPRTAIAGCTCHRQAIWRRAPLRSNDIGAFSREPARSRAETQGAPTRRGKRRRLPAQSVGRGLEGEDQGGGMRRRVVDDISAGTMRVWRPRGSPVFGLRSKRG